MSVDDTRRYVSDASYRKAIAHREFVRAMRTGRMMAFVGSYATQSLGYPTWADLLRETIPCSRKGLAALRKSARVLGEDAWIAKAWRLLDDPRADRVVLHELLDQFFRSKTAIDKGWSIGTCDREFHAELSKKLVNLFALHALDNEPVEETTVWHICRNLGIRRVITTNYDMEFEYELMMDEHDRWRGVTGDWRTAREHVYMRCQNAIERRRERSKRDEGSMSRFDFAIEHTLPDSRRIVSDCFQRERSDKLFEFAIGSPDSAWHIMHLHGRISDPETLVLSYSDYNRQYRQSSITKLPFEHAMRVLFAGNPILFVGMGMREEEILAALRQFVSDGTPGYVAHHFVIWSVKDRVVSVEDEQLRLRLYREFGVYVLFDCELDDYQKVSNDRMLPESINFLARFADKRVKSVSWTDHGAATQRPDPTMFYAQPLTQGGDFRDMQDYLLTGMTGLAERQRALGKGSLVWAGRNPLGTGTGWHGRERFSTVELKYEAPQKLPRPVAGKSGLPGYDAPIAWGLKGLSGDDYLTHVLTGGSPIKAFIDRPGAGHGNLASIVGDFVLDELQPAREKALSSVGSEMLYFQLNGSFTWELDAAFSLVSGLFDDRTAYRAQQSRDAAAQQFFGEITTSAIQGEPIKRGLFIAINGADRFFDSAGYPLSNELDLLIRLLPQFRKHYRRHAVSQGTVASLTPDERLYDYIHSINGGVHPVTLLLFGTARVGRYLASLGIEQGNLGTHRIADYDVISGSPEPFASSEPAPRTFFSQVAMRPTRDGKANPLAAAPGSEITSLYFRSVDTQFRAMLGNRGSVETIVPTASRTAFYQQRNLPEADARRPFFDIYLDAKLLAQTLSDDATKGRRKAALALDLLRVLAFVGQPVMSSTLAIALDGARIPLGEDAEAVDQGEVDSVIGQLLELNLVLELEQYPGVNPENLHDDRRRYGLHRALLHEIRDRNSVPFSDARNYTSFNIPLLTAQPIDDHEPEDRVQRVIEHMVEFLIDTNRNTVTTLEYGMQLRAAFAALRSYYTTSTLLMHQPEAFPSDRANPKLPRHAELLDKLIHWAEVAAHERANLPTPPDYPPNFFADDLVWLHAQRGVALMAFGDLYGARDSLGKAATLNARFVEFGDHGQNWRRIQLNQIHLDIERAKIASAEARIRDLKSSINRAVDEHTLDASCSRLGGIKARNAFEAIMQAYGTAPRLRVREVDPYFAADLILATGIACGYRGWCEYLRGRLRTAENYLAHCVQILRNIGEQRAYALFARHYASLLHAIDKREEARDVLLLCQAAADSSRQMDISHLAALSRAEHRFEHASRDERADLLHSVMDTLRYASLTDMYRVRLEARRVLALMRFRDGDFDGALEQASEALAVAARYGFTLRKIALRILVGQILVKRGDPISGAALLERASRIADRLGYQRAVEEAYRVRTGGAEPLR